MYVARGGVGRKGDEVVTDSSHFWPCISKWLVETEVEVGRGCAWVRIGKAFSSSALLFSSLVLVVLLVHFNPAEAFYPCLIFLCLRL